MPIRNLLYRFGLTFLTLVTFEASANGISGDPVGNPPTITDIANQSTVEDTATGEIAFTVGDVETAAADLTVTAVSSNQTLVPDANFVFGGSGASRTVIVIPAANQNGSTTFTVTVRDGDANSNSDSFLLTVTPVDNPPTIDQGVGHLTVVMSEDGWLQAWTAPDLSATDVDSGASLTWSVLTPAGNGTATVSGTGASPTTFTYAPASNYNGLDSFVVQVSDGTGTDTIQVDVRVIAIDDPPVITGQAALSTLVETPLELTLSNLMVSDPDNASYPTGFTLYVQDGNNYDRTDNTITPDLNFNGNLTVPVKVNSGVTSITLAWDANNEPELIGYNIYYDINSGQPYTPDPANQAYQGPPPITVLKTELNDPNKPKYTLTGLTP